MDPGNFGGMDTAAVRQAVERYWIVEPDELAVLLPDWLMSRMQTESSVDVLGPVATAPDAVVHIARFYTDEPR